MVPINVNIYMEKIMENLKTHGKIVAPCLRGFGNTSYHNPIKNMHELANDIHVLT